MERFSINISKQMKRQLEAMAKTNFRNLNGEINKALDDYIKRNGVGVDINAPDWWEKETEGSVDAPSGQALEPQEQSSEVISSFPHQEAPVAHQSEPIRSNLFNNDEIEEF